MLKVSISFLMTYLDVDKAPDPDEIPNKILEYCATEIRSSNITSNIYSITDIRELTRRLAYCRYNANFYKGE